MNSSSKASKIKIIRADRRRLLWESNQHKRFKGMHHALKMVLEFQRMLHNPSYSVDFDQWTGSRAVCDAALHEGARVVDARDMHLDLDTVERVILDDFKGLKGPIAVESKNVYSDYSLFYRISNNIYYLLANTSIRSAIFIIYDSIGDVDLIHLQDSIDTRFVGVFNTLILDAEEVTGMRINRPFIKYLSESLFSNPKKVSEFDVSRYDEKFDDKRLELVVEAFRTRPMTVFVGAGLSASSGMPSWPQLIENLWFETIRGRAKFEDISNEYLSGKVDEIIGDSLLIKARMLQVRFGNTLYLRMRDEIYKSDSHESELLEAVSNLICALNSSNKLGQILTLNYDDLLEQSLRRLGLNSSPWYGQSLYRDEDLNVFHVHGYLPRKPNEIDLQMQKSIVFSESSYNILSSDSYSPINIRIIQRLIEDSCLFIGQSMTDPNIRRLLEVSQKVRPGRRHFWFKRIDEVDKSSSDKNVIMSHLAYIQEDIMSALGVHVIWYKSHKDLPLMIGKIKAMLFKQVE